MKFKYIISAIAVLAICSSCKNYLDLSDPNAVTVKNYYQEETDIERSVNGVYAQVKSGAFCGTSTFYFEECKARMLTYPDTGVGGGTNAQFDNCTVVPSNTIVLDRWNAIYNCIDRANVVLKHVGDITYNPATKKDAYEAEVRFVRALCYYTLVTTYGDVPLVLEKLENLAAVNEANVRITTDKVYQAIFDDCAFVVNSPIADLQNAANCGRASKVAALTLWGKALLQMATDEAYASQKATLCKTAQEKLSAAWNKKPFSDFASLDVQEPFIVGTQDGAKENIFQLCYIGGSNSANSGFNGSFRPTSIDDPACEVNYAGNSGSFFMPLMTTYNIFDEVGDLRFNKLMAHGNHKGSECYYTLKYLDLDPSGYAGCNFVLLRYADVALMLAEAYYHGGSDDEAVKYLNYVRNRAGLASIKATGKTLRDAIYKERQREFCYEGKAYSDMKRGYTKAEMLQIMKDGGATEYSNTDWLCPIPNTQHILNPVGLWQNEGY